MSARVAGVVAGILLPAALLAGDERVTVPGGVAAIRRLVGLDPYGPEATFFVELHEHLLFGAESEETWSRVEKRRAIVDFVADLGEWRREFGDRAFLSTSPGEEWRRTSKALEWLGIEVSGGGSGFEASTRGDPQFARRRALLAALGAPPRLLLSKLRAGDRVAIEAADGAVLLPSVLGGDSRWFGAAGPAGAFLALVRDVKASRVLVALAALDRETREELAKTLRGERGGPLTLEDIDDELLDLLSLYPDSVELSAGRFVLPGGDEADAVWSEIFGVSPRSARFLRALAETDSRKGAYVVDALQQVPGPRARTLVLGGAAGKEAAARFRRLYRAIQTGTGFDAPRRDPYDFGHLAWFLGEPAGGLDPSHATLDGEAFPKNEQELAAMLADARRSPEDSDEKLRRLFRQDVAGATAGASPRRFAFVSSLVASRPELADPGVVLVLLRGMDRFFAAYALFEDLPFDPALARRYVFALDRLDRRGPSRDSEIAAGLLQASAEILAQVVRSGAVPPIEGRRLFSDLLDTPLFAGAVSPALGAGPLFLWLTERLLPALAAPPTGEVEEETGDDRLTRALVGSPAAATIDWRGGRYVYDPAADETARRTDFRERQRLSSLADLVQMHRAREALLATARAGSAERARARAVALVEALRLPPPEGEAPGAAARTISPAERRAREAAGDLARVRGGSGLREVEAFLPAIDAVIAERHLEALLGHVYAASAGDPGDLYYQDPDFVRRHTFRTVEKGGKVIESPFRQTSLVSQPGRGLAVSGSVWGLPDVLGLLHAEQIVYRAGARISLDPIRSGLIAPIRRMSAARLEEDAVRFVAAACRATEEHAAALAARAPRDRYAAWRSLARDLVSRARLAALAELGPGEATPEVLEGHLTPSDLLRIGRRLALDPSAEPSSSAGAGEARAAWERLRARLGERGAEERLAEFGPRAAAFAGRFRLADLDLPPYERLARYRTPVLFADRLYDLKVAIARQVAESGLPAAILSLLVPRALDEMISRLSMAFAYDWRSIARASRSFGPEDFDRFFDEAVTAGRLVRDQSQDPVEEAL